MQNKTVKMKPNSALEHFVFDLKKRKEESLKEIRELNNKRNPKKITSPQEYRSRLFHCHFQRSVKGNCLLQYQRKLIDADSIKHHIGLISKSEHQEAVNIMISCFDDLESK